MEKSNFLDTREAAEFLNLKKNTLEIWRVRGDGPAYRQFGRAIRYRLTDLELYVEKCARRSTSESEAA
jgi:excisionase family DNA binding protein